jgi:cephalosporin hydroxylase
VDSKFEARNRRIIGRMTKDRSLRRASADWIVRSAPYEYSYHFKWLGVPIIQYPADIIAMQEIVWSTRPDLIVETGVARGGSMIFYASLLELLGGKGRVVGVDLDIRPHSRKAITAHPLSRRILLLEGSSTDVQVVRRVYDLARRHERIMVVLDSNHTHEHVATELELYSPLVRKGGYIVVFDTVIERFPAGYFADRPWDKGDNPMTAVQEFLSTNKRFIVDPEMDKLLLTVAPEGYLLCVRDPPTGARMSKRRTANRPRQT